jgi:hypothetical protein
MSLVNPAVQQQAKGWMAKELIQFLVDARDLSHLHRILTSYGAHLTSYPMWTGGSFPRGKVAGP